MENFASLCKTFLIIGLILYLIFDYVSNDQYLSSCQTSDFFSSSQRKPSNSTESTNLSHLGFGLVGSEAGWHSRKSYIESWWKPKVTRGVLFLDKAPTGGLLPWSRSSPPYKVSEDLTVFLNKTDVTAQRIINGIKEAFKVLDNENLRWLVMGDDDSIFFLDNIVDVLGGYDHNKYYYFGGNSEFILSNYWYSFSQGFGGAGFILSYPLAKALAEDMENCLRRYRYLNAADQTTMSCIADIGVALTPLKGIHQIDLRGDLSGFLSSHPKFPLMSLHHFDMVSPIFPSKDRFESTRHLMKAASVDQTRILQQTICYQRQKNWSFSISWGYSVCSSSGNNSADSVSRIRVYSSPDSFSFSLKIDRSECKLSCNDLLLILRLESFEFLSNEHNLPIIMNPKTYFLFAQQSKRHLIITCVYEEEALKSVVQ